MRIASFDGEGREAHLQAATLPFGVTLPSGGSYLEDCELRRGGKVQIQAATLPTRGSQRWQETEQGFLSSGTAST